jgi:S-DNA-T family DNA segregation ATPase FtsK/SpoIIIE
VADTTRLDEAKAEVATLTECRGPDAGRIHTLGVGSYTIGRATEADISLRDPDMSRMHAELSVWIDAIEIRDLSSKNGMVLDGARLASGATRQLADGARIEIGGLLLELAHPGARVRGALEAGGHATYTRSLDLPLPGNDEQDSPRGPWLAALAFAILIGVLLTLGGCS